MCVNKIWFAFYADDPAPETKVDDPPVVDDSKKVFTQDEVNSIVAQERKRNEERVKKTVADLERIQKSKSLTESEKNSLQAKIEELNNTLLTKEELTVKERKKLEEQHKKDVDALANERETWKNRYTDSSILRTISDAAMKEDAFSSNQITAILKPLTQLKEETDGEGNPTGKFVPRVAYPDTDKEGKQVTLDLTVPEAVKRMKDTPEVYGNLFKSTAAGGAGAMPSGSSPGSVDVTKMSADQYMKHRASLGLGPKNRSPVLK
jgi:hypothetical protein